MLNGMSIPAASSIDLRWGDTALANFYGTSARADAADPLSSAVLSMLSEPEGLASPFVKQAFASQEIFRANDIDAHAASAAGVAPHKSPQGAFLLVAVVALVAFVVAYRKRA